MELKYRRGDQIIHPICRIGSSQEIRSPLINFRKFQKIEKSTIESCRTHWSLINDEGFESLKFVELKDRKGDQVIQPICRIGSHQEITSPLLNLRKFLNIEKNSEEWCRTHSNLLNEKQFESPKFVELKHRMGDRIIQRFCRICCLQEIKYPLFNLRKF